LTDPLKNIAMDLTIESVTTDVDTGTGIQTSNLVVHHTFDTTEIEGGIGLNAGSLGGDANAYFLTDTSTDEYTGDWYLTNYVLNSTSILGQAHINDFNSTQGTGTIVQLGSHFNRDQWTFLNDDTTNYSISFWINGDLNQPSSVPVINTLTSFAFLNGLTFGFDSGAPYLTINQDDLDIASSTVIDDQTFALTLPNDGNFHLVTLGVEMSNTTSTAQACIDLTCDTIDRDSAPITYGTTWTLPDRALVIGEDQDERATPSNNDVGGRSYSNFQMDDLCIWTSLLTSTERSTLFNGGTGSSCATVTTTGGGGGAGLTTGDLVNATDSVIITPPTIPEGILDLTGDTVLNTCELSWSAPITTSTINGYKILRQINGGGFITLIANTSNTLTTHIDGGLTMNVLYEYDVLAGNKFGFATVSSNIVDCTPIVSGVSTAPLSLTAINVGSDVQLDWLEPTDGDPTGYQIQRKVTSTGSWITIVNDTGTTSLTFLDTTVNPSTEYVYRLGGWNSFGLGAFSQEATINTLTLADAPFLTAQQVGDEIVLNWIEPTSGSPINGYKIDRRINLGTLTTFVANTTTTSLTFTDSNVTKPDTFGYRVRALSDLGEGSVSNIVDVVFGSHLVIHVREQDGSGFKGGGIVKGENATFSDLIGLDTNSDAIFDNLAVFNYNFTFFDDDNYILNKTFNFPSPAGNDTSEFTINALVFDVDCPDNGAGTDIRIKVNYTDAKDITEFPSTPVCDSTDQVSWSTRWQGDAVNDTSTMIADFISTVFKANAEQFLASADIIPTIYNSGANQIESETYVVNMTDVTINFNLFLGRAPSGGGAPSPSPSNPAQPTPSIPDPEIVFEQRLTGLSLLSRTHQFAQAGDVIEGSITVNWEGELNLDVRAIDTSKTDLDIRFDLTPFPLDQTIVGIGEFAMSTADIPYMIVLPADECNPEIGLTQNCFDPLLHTIPLEFEFQRDDQVYEASTEVFVDGRPIPLDIVQLQIILLFLVLIASAVFGRFIRNRARGSTRRTKTKKKKFKKKFDSS